MTAHHDDSELPSTPQLATNDAHPLVEYTDDMKRQHALTANPGLPSRFKLNPNQLRIVDSEVISNAPPPQITSSDPDTT